MKTIRQGDKGTMALLVFLPGGNATAEALAAPEDFFDMEFLIHGDDADVQSRITGWVAA